MATPTEREAEVEPGSDGDKTRNVPRDLKVPKSSVERIETLQALFAQIPGLKPYDIINAMSSDDVIVVADVYERSNCTEMPDIVWKGFREFSRYFGKHKDITSYTDFCSFDEFDFFDTYEKDLPGFTEAWKKWKAKVESTTDTTENEAKFKEYFDSLKRATSFEHLDKLVKEHFKMPTIVYHAFSVYSSNDNLNRGNTCFVNFTDDMRGNGDDDDFMEPYIDEGATLEDFRSTYSKWLEETKCYYDFWCEEDHHGVSWSSESASRSQSAS